MIEILLFIWVMFALYIVIKYAVKHAVAGDIVVIAGKGHENYQEIEGLRHWFDDVVEVQGALGCQPLDPNLI